MENGSTELARTQAAVSEAWDLFKAAVIEHDRSKTAQAVKYRAMESGKALNALQALTDKLKLDFKDNHDVPETTARRHQKYARLYDTALAKWEVGNRPRPTWEEMTIDGTIALALAEDEPVAGQPDPAEVTPAAGGDVTAEATEPAEENGGAVAGADVAKPRKGRSKRKANGEAERIEKAIKEYVAGLLGQGARVVYARRDQEVTVDLGAEVVVIPVK